MTTENINIRRNKRKSKEREKQKEKRRERSYPQGRTKLGSVLLQVLFFRKFRSNKSKWPKISFYVQAVFSSQTIRQSETFSLVKHSPPLCGRGKAKLSFCSCSWWSHSTRVCSLLAFAVILTSFSSFLLVVYCFVYSFFVKHILQTILFFT